MRIGGSGTIEVNVLPSGDGTMRGNDLVSERNGIFVANFPLLGGVSAEYGMCQLYNALGSGVVVLIDWMYIYGGSQAKIQFWDQTAALADDGGVWTTRSNIGVDGITHWFTETNATVPGTEVIEFQNVSADPKLPFGSFPFPFILPEEHGLAVVAGATNEAFQITLMGREV